MAKIIAQVGKDAEVFELYFSEPLSEHSERNLALALEGAGFKVKRRNPSGRQQVWECVLPVGDVVDQATIDIVKSSLEVSGFPV